MLDQVQFTLIHGPNIPSSYAILFFAASDFAFITRHIHNWASFLLWSICFILSGTTCKLPLLFPSSILDTFWPRGLIFWFSSFCLFILFMGFSRKEYWIGLPFPPPVDHVLSELFTMTYQSLVTLHSMTHSFIEFYKPLHYNKDKIHSEPVQVLYI